MTSRTVRKIRESDEMREKRGVVSGRKEYWCSKWLMRAVKPERFSYLA
jgi:hypothetical protein